MIDRLLIAALLALLSVGASNASAAAKAALEPSYVNIDDRASLQRGAALFMNYCAGCHSLGFQRYSRTAQDLGLTEEQVMSYLNFAGTAFGGPMVKAMDKDDAAAWFGGKAPPDLSLVARAKGGGPDWTYTFLKSFYVDETRPSGWNNTVLVGSSMPNVLWHLQGTQRPIFEGEGNEARVVGFQLAPEGRQSQAEFEQTIRDITAFLTYVAEPAALKREALGVWVILFLTVFTLLAWLLKHEYWRDVH